MPADLGDDLVAKAEGLPGRTSRGVRATRAEGAGSWGCCSIWPRRLRTRSSAQRLLAEERAGPTPRPDCRSTPAVTGPPTSHARLPDHVASRLRTYLEAFTSPTAYPRSATWTALPTERRRGEALCALLENLPDTGLPVHGGSATSVTVMLDLDQLISGLGGVAVTSTGDRLTAEQARRLRLPGPDHPRRPRPQGRGSSTSAAPPGCSHRPSGRRWASATSTARPTDAPVPAAWCEAHHAKEPWSRRRQDRSRRRQTALLLPPP